MKRERREAPVAYRPRTVSESNADASELTNDTQTHAEQPNAETTERDRRDACVCDEGGERVAIARGEGLGWSEVSTAGRAQ